LIFFRLDGFYERLLISLYVLIIIFGVIGNLTLGAAFLTNKVKLCISYRYNVLTVKITCDWSRGKQIDKMMWNFEFWIFPKSTENKATKAA
jgi:hypothetical protein